MSYIYELRFAETEIEAEGLDKVFEITRQLEAVVQAALESDTRVLRIVGGPHVVPKGSTKNYLNPTPDT